MISSSCWALAYFRISVKSFSSTASEAGEEKLERAVRPRMAIRIQKALMRRALESLLLFLGGVFWGVF